MKIIRKKKMRQSINTSINNNDYLQLLFYNLSKIKKGCQCGFIHCRICEQDYSVQWADTAVTQLYKDKVITKRMYNNIISKLYGGYRG